MSSTRSTRSRARNSWQPRIAQRFHREMTPVDVTLHREDNLSMLRRTFLLLSTAFVAFAALPDVIKTDNGQVSGTTGKDASVRVFKGIPFAASPAGENRWKAPQPAAKW